MSRQSLRPSPTDGVRTPTGGAGGTDTHPRQPHRWLEEVITREKIILRCPITLRRMSQPCRGPACSHASCFCVHAVDCIRVGSGNVRCPICESTFAESELAVDAALTVFLSQEPTASHAYVSRGAAGEWRYRIAARTVASALSVTDDVVLKGPNRSCTNAGSSSTRPVSDAACSSLERRIPRSASALVPRNIALARSERGSFRPGTEGSRRMMSTANTVGLPRKLSVEERATRRAEHKARAERQRFLALAKTELIRRALQEETPPGGDPNGWSVG